ncbi:MAG TPA: aminoacyl-tRNA hydrolase [Dissulfurispiraceae bacterium]|nr:aminoacyl-tRNA hydrolase [Dissulfurispiraceae bacterium]
MWLIAGLGNPGEKYSATRHNIGFMVLDDLAERNSISFSAKDEYLIGKGTIERVNATLIKPLTYMNLSGAPIKKVLKKSNLIHDGEISNLIVVHDDLDLNVGIVKIRRNGSSGGHKGIESIIGETGTKEFIRIKIGIGRDSGIPVEDFVLRKFRPAEKKGIEDGILKAVNAIELILAGGIEKAMNECNRAAKT